MEGADNSNGNIDFREILLKGPEVWNKWREENPMAEINLEKFDLNGANLEKFDLNGANLIEANLERANLRNANLGLADLRIANLVEAQLEGAILRKANLREADLSRAYFRKAKLEEAKLYKANLSGANLRSADLTSAYMYEANLSGAKLDCADLTSAYMYEANLSGAKLDCANLCRVNAGFSIVDGETKITNCPSFKADFSGVGLDTARIDSSLKAQLQTNIRKNYWEKRYRENIFLNIARIFWWFSDYGSSTIHLIVSFATVSLIYSLIYLIPESGPSWAFWPTTSFDTSFLLGLDAEQYSAIPSDDKFFILLGRAIYFSVVTMTTLGFGDISAHPLSLWGHLLVMTQVLFGYVLLGALITRLSILFQDVA